VHDRAPTTRLTPAPSTPPTTPARIQTRNAWVEFPIFDAKARSLKTTFLGNAGPTIGRNTTVIEALHNITLSLGVGDRVGLCPSGGVKGFGRRFPRRPASLKEGTHVRVEENIARRAVAGRD
jgi:hypothetical protein